MDKLKWVVVIFLITLFIVLHHFYAQSPLLYRVLVGLGATCLVLGVFLTTNKGRFLYKLFKDARIEMKKVVWPTRIEVFHTAIVVIVAVIIVGIILWGLDSMFSWLISLLVG